MLQPLTHLFNLSFKTGYIPPQLKFSIIKPIYKSDNRHLFTNYRPISILSSLAHLIEKTVCGQLIGYLEQNNILYMHQYGFRSGHNTAHALGHFCNEIHSALAENKFNISLFIDLKKAFDTVSFDLLFKKLNHYGVDKTELLWFSNYLYERKQSTDINGIMSDVREVNMGVPQGSVAGPLLFVIFINDLFLATDMKTILFADDTTFQCTGSNLHELYDRVNYNLVKIENWFNANGLTLHPSKTKYMLFTNNKEHYHIRNIYLCGSKVDRVGEDCKDKYFKFLGMLVDEKLNWKYHINMLRKKLASSNFALSNSKHKLPYKSRLSVFQSLINSHINYCAIIYTNTKAKELNMLETLHKKALRHLKLAK